MKNIKMIFLGLVFVTVTSPVVAADMGVSLGYDLDALWAAAQQDFATQEEDAVILLESREITLNQDGTESTRVHRVVWITSSVGIRSYADLRVPWDSATGKLEVEVLRTWRDGRWWPDPESISETAVVHTLPHALRTAYDYQTMRETMLLHDGVELPCIMETAYTITGRPGFEHTDGLFVMSRRDPAVRVVLTLTAPAGIEIKHEALNGAPAPAVEAAGGEQVLTWSLENVAPLRMPIAAAPERYEPAVVWSTWPDWETLRKAWDTRIEADAVLTPALADTLARFRADHAADGETTGDLVDWLDESVRAVRYDPTFWFGRTRSAQRIWETGYGHGLDRAILLLAMLDDPHDRVQFRGSVRSGVAPDVPRLSGLGDLVVRDDGSDSFIDPAHRVVVGAAAAPTLSGDESDTGGLQCGTGGLSGTYCLRLSLEPEEDGSWRGEGHFTGSDVFTDRTRITSSAHGAADHLQAILGSVLEGAELTSSTPLYFASGTEEFQFEFTLPPVEEDAFLEKKLVLGEPAFGLLAVLPGDVDPGDQTRQSPVILGHHLGQHLEVSFKDPPARIPAAFALDGDIGRFRLGLEQENGWTVIRRDLELKAGRVEPGDWPALRALLLEEQDPRHGTILFD